MENIDELPKNIIKAEMTRKGLKVRDMVQLLKPYGEDLTELSFNNKMARKTFSAIFFMKCIKALGVKQVKIED
jgi:lambda repressor-like predicted transcriptional regulator